MLACCCHATFVDDFCLSLQILGLCVLAYVSHAKLIFFQVQTYTKGNCGQFVAIVRIAKQPFFFTAGPSVGDCSSNSESLEVTLEV